VNEPPPGSDEPEPGHGTPSGPPQGDSDGSGYDPWTPDVNPEDPVPRARRSDVVQRRSREELQAGTVYSNFLADQLAEERSLRSKLENRGIALAVASGVMVSLLFVVTVVFAAISKLSILKTDSTVLGLAIVFLIVAALSGLFAVYFIPIRDIVPQYSRRRLSVKHYSPTEIDEIRGHLLNRARQINSLKKLVLAFAALSQLLSILFLSFVPFLLLR